MTSVSLCYRPLPLAEIRLQCRAEVLAIKRQIAELRNYHNHIGAALKKQIAAFQMLMETKGRAIQQAVFSVVINKGMAKMAAQNSTANSVPRKEFGGLSAATVLACRNAWDEVGEWLKKNLESVGSVDQLKEIQIRSKGVVSKYKATLERLKARMVERSKPAPKKNVTKPAPPPPPPPPPRPPGTISVMTAGVNHGIPEGKVVNGIPIKGKKAGGDTGMCGGCSLR